MFFCHELHIYIGGGGGICLAVFFSKDVMKGAGFE